MITKSISECKTDDGETVKPKEVDFNEAYENHESAVNQIKTYQNKLKNVLRRVEEVGTNLESTAKGSKDAARKANEEAALNIKSVLKSCSITYSNVLAITSLKYAATGFKWRWS